MSSTRTLVLVPFTLLLIFAALPVLAQPIHSVHVGTPDACDAFGLPPGCDKNFSLTAIEFADGRVIGQYTDRFGGGLGGIHAAIDCLTVVGNQAWVSGVITKGEFVPPGEEPIDLAGLPIATRVRDNGKSQNDPPDEISFSFILGATPCTDMTDYELVEVPQGQVVVK